MTGSDRNPLDVDERNLKPGQTPALNARTVLQRRANERRCYGAVRGDRPDRRMGLSVVFVPVICEMPQKKIIR